MGIYFELPFILLLIIYYMLKFTNYQNKYKS